MADGGGAAAFLGVSRSLSGREWRQRPAEAGLIRSHMQGLNLEEPLARALAARGVRADQGADFLTPTLKALFPDPSSFMDMDAAAGAILDALQAQASIHVFADYDVDGASSAALLVRWFRAMGATLPIYVPDRVTEGYGPSARAFDTLKASGADLVITVDCGAAANEAVAHAAAIGLKVVVIDHHMMREHPPVCAAVVNPNRPGCNSGQGNLAAAGVVFVLLAALNREARRRGLFGDIKEPDIRQWLDLAAMGAICDVTGLTGFNRALTSLGLRVMSDWANPGLKALLAAAGAEPGPAKSNHAGFILGPRLNAAGRLADTGLGIECLITDDEARAANCAQELDRLNRERRRIEGEMLDEATAALDGLKESTGATQTLFQPGWHQGVVGVIAARLVERYRRPALVIGLDGATGRGSARSVAQSASTTAKSAVDQASTAAATAGSAIKENPGKTAAVAGAVIATAAAAVAGKKVYDRKAGAKKAPAKKPAAKKAAAPKAEAAEKPAKAAKPAADAAEKPTKKAPAKKKA
jgi:single-stranded-DNA-specific exonuclease